jgi:hypothetical protein
MSTITINIGNDDAVKSFADVASPSSSHESADGGAPQFSDLETSSTSQLDIGGPPSWLADAIGGKIKSGANEVANATADGDDGGAAKVKFS